MHTTSRCSPASVGSDACTWVKPNSMPLGWRDTTGIGSSTAAPERYLLYPGVHDGSALATV